MLDLKGLIEVMPTFQASTPAGRRLSDIRQVRTMY
jgi:hypothetical protein